MRALLFILLLTSCSTATTSNTKVGKEEILTIMDQQVESWNQGDLEGFMQPYQQDDSLTFIGSRGRNFGWQTTLDNYKKSYPNKEAMGQLSFSDQMFHHITDSTCFLSGQWKLERKVDTLSGYYTLFWKKTNGQWVITTDHSS